MELTYYYDESLCDDGSWILFNILTGKIITISEYLHDILYDKKLDLLSDFEKKTLTDTGFLVESHDIEVRNLTEQFKTMKFNSENFVVTILTNMNCNLGCKYCHENGLMDHTILTDEKINKINQWIEKQIASRKYKSVMLYFYGGEPTLNMRAVERIATFTTKLGMQYGFKHNYSMATNATLLNDELVNQLVKADVVDLQVTLDGPPSIHDFRKPNLDGSGTFDIILNNVLKYYNRINFTIRANVDKNNYEYIPKLLDIIKEKELYKKVYFYLDLVSATHNNNEYCTNNVLTTLEEMTSITYLWKEQINRGIPLHGKNVIEGLCGNLSNSNITISSSGEFYICPGLCGIKQANLGNLDDGYNVTYNQLLSTEVWTNCKCCKYFPMCAGGCRAQAFMHNGSCFACYCKKSYYDKVVMEYIKYKYGKSNLH